VEEVEVKGTWAHQGFWAWGCSRSSSSRARGRQQAGVPLLPKPRTSLYLTRCTPRRRGTHLPPFRWAPCRRRAGRVGGARRKLATATRTSIRTWGGSSTICGSCATDRQEARAGLPCPVCLRARQSQPPPRLSEFVPRRRASPMPGRPRLQRQCRERMERGLTAQGSARGRGPAHDIAGALRGRPPASQDS